MKTAALIACLAAALPVIAIPTSAHSHGYTPARFLGAAIRAGSEIDSKSINAAATRFWIGKDSLDYCPPRIDTACHAGTPTIFIGGANTLALDVMVPWGQQIFVDNTGALRFTVAHASPIMPDPRFLTTGFGVIDKGFHLQFEGADFLACPAHGAYQIYAAARAGGNSSMSCLPFAFRISGTDILLTYEYI